MGLGDGLMATGEVRELRKKNPLAKFIIGDGKRSYWNEVFDYNPYIIRGSEAKKHNKIIWIKNYEGNRPYRNYGQNYPKDNYNWKDSYKTKKGEIFFSQKEIYVANHIVAEIKKKTSKKIIYIEPHIKKRLGYENRNWGFHKWEKIVQELNTDYEFIQITYGDRKQINGCININGLNFRSSAAVLSMCDLFIGPEGGMHHAAAATNRKAIVIFGGHISPDLTGYDFHTNLYVNDSQSPCGNKKPCDHCKRCLEKITPRIVMEEIKKII